MQIILLQDIKGLGKKYDVKNAASGHVRNFLLPRKLVMPATKENLARLELLKKNMAKEDEDLVKRLHEIKTQIEAHPIEFDLKADEKGNLYGAVTKEAILKALREHGVLRTEHADIHIEHPIKSAGEFTAEVDLKKGIKATLTIIVRPQE